MLVNFVGHSVEVTPALQSLVENKLERVRRHFDHITSAEVVFNVDHIDQIVKITVTVPDHQFHAEATDKDMYKAIDEMIDRLDRQIVKYKEKISSHRG